MVVPAPYSDCWSTLAPFASSVSTMVASPLYAAMCKTERPVLHWTSTLAPLSMSTSTVDNCRLHTALRSDIR
eukprot:6274642-Pyramimonas_sp.AAC.2